MKFIFTFLLVAPLYISAQSKKEILKDIKEGYKTESGWIIKEGDTLKLGKGTLPNKSFAFIYSNPKNGLMAFGNASLAMGSPGMYAANMANSSPNGGLYLTSNQARRAIVKELLVTGTKKGGYTIIAKADVGSISKYWIEIDNAISTGEILVPKEYTNNN